MFTHRGCIANCAINLPKIPPCSPFSSKNAISLCNRSQKNSNRRKNVREDSYSRTFPNIPDHCRSLPWLLFRTMRNKNMRMRTLQTVERDGHDKRRQSRTKVSNKGVALATITCDVAQLTTLSLTHLPCCCSHWVLFMMIVLTLERYSV